MSSPSKSHFVMLYHHGVNLFFGGEILALVFDLSLSFSPLCWILNQRYLLATPDLHVPLKRPKLLIIRSLNNVGGGDASGAVECRLSSRETKINPGEREKISCVV